MHPFLADDVVKTAASDRGFIPPHKLSLRGLLLMGQILLSATNVVLVHSSKASGQPSPPPRQSPPERALPFEGWWQ